MFDASYKSGPDFESFVQAMNNFMIFDQNEDI